MRLYSSSRMLALMAHFFILISQTAGHSWVEQLTVIAPNGTFVGDPGYPRAFVPRGEGFDDQKMQHLIPANGRPTGTKILATDKICRDTQLQKTQTSGFPRLKAAQGAFVALRYQENGHVTLPESAPGKPDNRGTVYVYGTTDPRPEDTLLSIHKVWNAKGTGGDGRGMLLSTHNYDDGRCHQKNDGPISTDRQKKFKHEAEQPMGVDLWCQNNLRLPANAPSGKPYTLYWVWDWSTVPGGDKNLPEGKPELYTTCIDIDIVAENKLKSLVAGSQQGYIKDQSLNRAAIASQMAQFQKAPVIPIGSKPRTDTALSPTEAAQSVVSEPQSNTPAPTRRPCDRRPTGFTTVAQPSKTLLALVTIQPPFVSSIQQTMKPVATSVPAPGGAQPSGRIRCGGNSKTQAKRDGPNNEMGTEAVDTSKESTEPSNRHPSLRVARRFYPYGEPLASSETPTPTTPIPETATPMNSCIMTP
ncbi:hypothetical protein AJ80_08327 [Polytolypa hystricis UAMH7299]|uniref:DUF7492 domain-containing protein n=1 Tax=Polytolypa hystricis (strain UAMH7299) TaxID=1447883 RepID=A0A2B7X8W0_POLH7|nr:hypothetical protein AJ80_08327 [Polytolypa hystricis UAMH7299]